jgi:outer membrane protein OmpA-like peptidoglycan-associated protein
MVRRRRFLWLVATLPVMALAPLLAGALPPPTVTAVVAAPPTAPPRPAPAAVRDFVTNHALGPVYFDVGRSTARPDDERILDMHAVWLKRNRNQLLLIEGHTDGPGRDATSMAIGGQRATWAKAYLVSKGVGADRIETISYGGTQPMCTEKTAICRAKNRRATFSTTRR